MTITIPTVTDAARDDIQRAFELQQASKWTAKNSTADERRDKLTRLKNAVVAHAADIDAALNQDLRRPTEAFNDGFVGGGVELGGVVGDIDVIIANLDEWMKPTEVQGLFRGTKSYLQYEARGQVLLFGPWNFPFLLVVQPLAEIIAAGNVALVKPNELSPHTSALTATIIREVFTEDEVAVFEGGIDTANALLELPVDHVFFTGSPAVGKTVMTAAAKSLASCTLELGGKCPAIIDKTMDLDLVAHQVMIGKMSNAGQICLAPDHVYVERDVRDDFIDRYMSAVQNKVYSGDAINHDRFARIINERNFDRVAGYVDDALNRGAKLIGSGRTDRETLTIEPSVLLDVPDDATVMRDEIFGPVLPVFDFDGLDDVIAQIRSRTKPLSLYVFTQNPAFKEKVLRETSAGGTTVNGWATNAFDLALPFGGVNHSGHGAYHAVYGFRELSHMRTVVEHVG